MGVSISRGDWDTAVDVLSKMELKEESILLKNNFPKTKSKKGSKKMYKGPAVSQALELGVLYAIDGGLPLLTRGAPEALQAMNLERLLPKESNTDNNSEIPSQIRDRNVRSEAGVAVKTQKVHNLNGISHSLSQIPKKLLLETSSKRTVCTMGDILGFLERCQGSNGVEGAEGGGVDRVEGGGGSTDEGIEEDRRSDGVIGSSGMSRDYPNEGSGSFDDYSTYDDYDAYVPKKAVFKKIPVGVALLQSLFAAAINERKYKQAARIIRLLEGSRLVIDLDAPALVAVPPIPAIKEEYDTSFSTSSSDSAEKIGMILRASDSPSDASAVKVVRETLARKWAALLIGSSLNKLKNNVAGSVKMMAALKYLQKEQTDDSI